MSYPGLMGGAGGPGHPPRTAIWETSIQELKEFQWFSPNHCFFSPFWSKITFLTLSHKGLSIARQHTLPKKAGESLLIKRPLS